MTINKNGQIYDKNGWILLPANAYAKWCVRYRILKNQGILKISSITPFISSVMKSIMMSVKDSSQVLDFLILINMYKVSKIILSKGWRFICLRVWYIYIYLRHCFRTMLANTPSQVCPSCIMDNQSKDEKKMDGKQGVYPLGRTVYTQAKTVAIQLYNKQGCYNSSCISSFNQKNSENIPIQTQ